MSKGDTYRPTNSRQFNDTFESIFGESRKHVCKTYVKNTAGKRVCYFCDEPAEVEVGWYEDNVKHE